MLDNHSFDVVMWIVGQVVVAAAIWGGIRADIRNMHKRIDRVEQRLDQHLSNRSQDKTGWIF